MTNKHPQLHFRKDCEGQSEYENYIGTIKNGADHGDKNYIVYTTDESFEPDNTTDFVKLFVNSAALLEALEDVLPPFKAFILDYAKEADLNDTFLDKQKQIDDLNKIYVRALSVIKEARGL